jgi:hypothetical protein
MKGVIGIDITSRCELRSALDKLKHVLPMKLIARTPTRQLILIGDVST